MIEQDYVIKDLKKKGWITNIKIFMFVILLVVEIVLIGLFFKNNNLLKTEPLGDKIAIVNFNKEITSEYVFYIMDEMEKIIDRKDYKEVLFIMSSPGGSPAASEELSKYLKYYTTKKKVNMYIEEMAASGGYYIASSIKPLVANKNAIVGSIGVIMPHYNISELAKKIGIEEDYIAAGKFKKPISPFRKITEEDEAYITKQIISPMYKNFIQSVATNRNQSFEKISELAEGKVYLANDKEIKGILIDKISSLYKEKNKLKEKYKKVKFFNISEKNTKSIFGTEVKLDLNIDNAIKSLGYLK